jgi:hypothetical protein
MAADSKVFIVARNQRVVPKQRRVERLPSGYSVQESRDDSQGSYWYVVTALAVLQPRNSRPVEDTSADLAKHAVEKARKSESGRVAKLAHGWLPSTHPVP